MANDLAARCTDLLYTEARLLDRQDWDGWLALYLPDAEYWIPAWDGEHRLVEDPQNEISLIYYADRTGLEDRVFRLRTNLSSASVPLPRTCHIVSNIQVEPAGPGEAAVHAHWQCTSFRFKQSHSYCGYYEYLLREHEGALRIARKKTVVINDVIPQVLDFYHV